MCVCVCVYICVCACVCVTTAWFEIAHLYGLLFDDVFGCSL